MTIHYIYQIVNRLNNKKYIGYTSKNPPEKRWQKHIIDIHSTETNHRPIYRALRKYGVENFYFEVIYCSKDGDYTLKTMENYFIEDNGSFITENGYNLTKGGDGNFGWAPSEETKLLWSSQRLGRKLTEEHKKKLSESQKLRYKNNPELREYYRQLAIINGARPPSTTKDSAKKSALTRMGGHIHTEEHKQMLRDLFKTNNHPFQVSELMEKRKETWRKIGRGTGAKNGNAVFCNIYDPENNLKASGYLREICEKYNFPFNKFLKAQRHGNPLQRGKWKNWKIVKI